MDEDLVRSMIESKSAEELDAQTDSNTGPPLREWDQHVSMLAVLIEEVRQTNILLIAQKAKKGTSLPKLKPVPRPTSMYQKVASKVRMDARLRKHDSLVARLLGDRAKKD